MISLQINFGKIKKRRPAFYRLSGSGRRKSGNLRLNDDFLQKVDEIIYRADVLSAESGSNFIGNPWLGNMAWMKPVKYKVFSQCLLLELLLCTQTDDLWSRSGNRSACQGGVFFQRLYTIQFFRWERYVLRGVRLRRMGTE